MNTNPIKFNIDKFCITLRYEGENIVISAFNVDEFDGHIVEEMISPNRACGVANFIKKPDDLYKFLEEQFNDYPNSKSDFCFSLIIKDKSLIIHFETVPTIKYIKTSFDIILTKKEKNSETDDKRSNTYDILKAMNMRISKLEIKINKLDYDNNKLINIVNSKITECNEKQYANINDIKNDINKIKQELSSMKQTNRPIYNNVKEKHVENDKMTNNYQKEIPIFDNKTMNETKKFIPILNDKDDCPLDNELNENLLLRILDSINEYN